MCLQTTTRHQACILHPRPAPVMIEMISVSSCFCFAGVDYAQSAEEGKGTERCQLL